MNRIRKTRNMLLTVAMLALLALFVDDTASLSAAPDAELMNASLSRTILESAMGANIPLGLPNRMLAAQDIVLTGKAIDAKTGSPIRGAIFVILKKGVTWNNYAGQQNILETAETDSRGIFLTRTPLGANTTYSVGLVADGYAVIKTTFKTKASGVQQVGTLKMQRASGNSQPKTPPPGEQVDVDVPGTRGLKIQLMQPPNPDRCPDKNYRRYKDTMHWMFGIRNEAKIPVTVKIDKTSLKMVDNTGKVYPLDQDLFCMDGPFDATGMPGIVTPAGVVFPAYSQNVWGVHIVIKDVPQTATYFDMHLTINGVPLVFRGNLD